MLIMNFQKPVLNPFFFSAQATWDGGASRRPHRYWSDADAAGMGRTLEAALCGKQCFPKGTQSGFCCIMFIHCKPQPLTA